MRGKSRANNEKNDKSEKPQVVGMQTDADVDVDCGRCCCYADRGGQLSGEQLSVGQKSTHAAHNTKQHTTQHTHTHTPWRARVFTWQGAGVTQLWASFESSVAQLKARKLSHFRGKVGLAEGIFLPVVERRAERHVVLPSPGKQPAKGRASRWAGAEK